MIHALATSWALLLGMALLMLGNGLQGTLLGVRANLEGFSTTITGVLMSGYFAGFLVGSMLAPRLVQRVGHARTFAALASLASTAILAHSVFVEPLTWVLMRLVSGFCYAGLYVVAESWLNEQATNETRGQLLSIYMVVSLGGMGLGQFLLNLADPAGSDLFILISVLVSLALLPMLLSVIPGPPIEVGGRRARIRELLRASPTGVVGMFMTLTAQGAFTGMGAVYAGRVGLNVREISLFMGAMVLGGVLLQWPIGRLSDRFDRRQILTCVTLLAALLAAAATVVEPGEPAMLAMVALYGGMALPMYSLCIAYTNDYLAPEQMVEASGTLILVAGLGAMFGPVTAALAMDLLGSDGFFWWLAAIHAGLGMFALFRMTVRRSPALADQGSYLPIPPRATGITAAWAAEMAAADEAAGKPERAGGEAGAGLAEDSGRQPGPLH